VLITGELGIGKTRLTHELRSWCAHRGIATAEARSYAAEGALAYGPVAAWLRSESLAAHRDRVAATAARSSPACSRSSAAPPTAAPGERARLRLFDALAHAILTPGPRCC
jgi:hypothetical protein